MKHYKRREALWLAASSLLLYGCGQAISSNAGAGSDADGSTNAGGSCATAIPSETAGPYPAHDDSAINCLRLSGIQRSDIRSSLGTGGYSGTATAAGIPLTITFTVANKSSCTPIAGYAFYLWHCDVNGKYSMYSSGVTTQTYLRGVQVTDSRGQATFQTIFPGCYDGRMPHMHFEIFPSLAVAVDDNYSVKTSQCTFPMATMTEAYNTSAYASSKSNLARVSYATDGVFSDGYANQVAAVSGNTSGYTANLIVAL